MKRHILLVALLGAILGLSAKTRKAVFVIIDGIPAQTIERLQPPTLMDIARHGRYSRAYCGGEVGAYSQTATISAIGYTNILTGTWVNKHNVRGNGNIEANYNYPTLFRIAKDQSRPVTTAIYSSWTDNRTILLGEGRPETRNLKVDYVFDGYDKDKQHYPDEPGDLHIQKIDGRVCEEAAKCIGTNAPDLNWIYLWYTDDAFHNHGHGQFSDESVMTVDRQLAPVWQAICQREKENDEEWLVIVTTDHGRTVTGKGHGGQTQEERTVWVITNQKRVNRQFHRPTLSHVDINPTICRWMDFQVPRDVEFERDGIPFIGPTDICNLHAETYDKQLNLTWDAQGNSGPATVWISPTNDFAKGGHDDWKQAGQVPARSGSYHIDLSPWPEARTFKIVVQTPATTLTRWLVK